MSATDCGNRISCLALRIVETLRSQTTGDGWRSSTESGTTVNP